MVCNDCPFLVIDDKVICIIDGIHSSIIDLFGYAGTVVVLQFSKELHSTGSSTVDGTLYASGVSGAVCFAAVISLYILEHRFDSSGRQKEMAGKIE